MAGSYRHITNSNNEFIGIDLIENLGDAHEALEECYQIIQVLSGGDKRKIYEADRQNWPPGNRDVISFEEYWNDE